MRRFLTSSATSILQALPSSPVDGQEIRYLADAAAGVVWSLRWRLGAPHAWNGALTGAWEYVGGGSLALSSVGADAVAPSSMDTWAAIPNTPVLLVPLAGEYEYEAAIQLAEYGNTAVLKKLTVTVHDATTGINEAAAFMPTSMWQAASVAIVGHQTWTAGTAVKWYWRVGQGTSAANTPGLWRVAMWEPGRCRVRPVRVG